MRALFRLLYREGESLNIRIMHRSNQVAYNRLLVYNADLFTDIDNLFRLYPTNSHHFYFTPIPRDGDIKTPGRIQTLFIDLDSKDFQDDFTYQHAIRKIERNLPPNARVASGNGYHYYWVLTAPIDADTHRRYEEALIHTFYADKSVKDLNRILRLPGSYNVKTSPPRYVTSEVFDVPPYDPAVFTELALDLHDRSESDREGAQFSDHHGSAAFQQEVIRFLAEHGDGFPDFADWVEVCLAAKSAGLSYDEIDLVFRGAATYNKEENQRRYESMQPDGRLTFGSLYHRARMLDQRALKVRLRDLGKTEHQASKTEHRSKKTEHLRAKTEQNTPKTEQPEHKTEQPHSKSYQDTPDGFLLSDLGNGQRMADQYAGKLRYVSVWRKWLFWNCHSWKVDVENRIQYLAKQTILDLYNNLPGIEDDKDRMTYQGFIKRSEHRSRLEAMVELTKSEPGVHIDYHDLDRASWKLCTGAGVVNLRTGQREEPNPADYITQRMAIDYDPDATCPQWLEFLHQIFKGNQSMLEFIQRAIGYSLTAETTERCLFILYGTGSNGKSTLVDTLLQMLGTYAAKTAFSTFLERKDDGSPRNDIAKLHNARFVAASESRKGAMFNEALIKELTGGVDKISCRFLYGEFFEYYPRYKIWLATNHKPRISGGDDGIWDRIRLIPFEVRFADDEKDPLLPGKLRAELPGIFNWAIEGCLKWQEEGLGMPPEVATATQTYRSDSDPIQRFLNETVVQREGCYVTVAELHKRYVEWCEEAGEKIAQINTFGRILSEKGMEKTVKKMDGKAKKVWANIDMRREGELLPEVTDYSGNLQNRPDQKDFIENTGNNGNRSVTGNQNDAFGNRQDADSHNEVTEVTEGYHDFTKLPPIPPSCTSFSKKLVTSSNLVTSKSSKGIQGLPNSEKRLPNQKDRLPQNNKVYLKQKGSSFKFGFDLSESDVIMQKIVQGMVPYSEEDQRILIEAGLLNEN
jgi:putative DNA primase/helicase